MYVNLDKTALEETMASANKEAIMEFGDDSGKDLLLYPDLDDKIVDTEVTENVIKMSFNNKLGFFSVEIPIDGVLEEVITMAIKRMNKMKALLESLK